MREDLRGSLSLDFKELGFRCLPRNNKCVQGFSEREVEESTAVYSTDELNHSQAPSAEYRMSLLPAGNTELGQARLVA